MNRLLCIVLVCGHTFACAQSLLTSKEVDSVYPKVHALYLDIHEHPELSGHETQTAIELATQFRNLGYQVSEHVGGTGVVAILRNGSGPTILLRTELDALPVEEKNRSPLRQQGPHQRRRGP